MKQILTALLLFSVSIIFSDLNAQSASFDAELAKQLNADEYGMKKYVIAFLYSGDLVSEYTQEEKSEIQKGHLANISLLTKKGKLVLAGPFFGKDEMRGIFLFDVTSIEEAEALTQSDPAVKAGVLKLEMKEWYGSAALSLIPEMHRKIQKTEFD